jgi:hypothetical protein
LLDGAAIEDATADDGLDDSIAEDDFGSEPSDGCNAEHPLKINSTANKTHALFFKSNTNNPYLNKFLAAYRIIIRENTSIFNPGIQPTKLL